MDTRTISVRTGDRDTVHDLTADCASFLQRSTGAGDGLLHLFVPHATAGIAILETGAGSDDDLLAALADLLPADGRLALGTWQSVCLVDLNVDNPDREVRMSFLPG